MNTKRRPPPNEAIALRYREDQDRAPTVVAKGGGTLADRILALAKEHQIPLYEDRDLVSLLGVLDLGTEIPPQLYRALAEVLAHIYRADRRARES